MDEHVVTSRRQLAAAIEAAAQPNFVAARANPFTVQLGTTRYRFPVGVTEARAAQLLHALSRTPARAFEVCAQQEPANG